MKKIFLALLSAVWFLNGNAMEYNHSRSSVPPLDFAEFEKRERSPIRMYSVFCQEEIALYNFCEDGLLNGEYLNEQQEIVKDFSELLNQFLKLEYPLIINNIGKEPVAEYIKSYLATNSDKIERLKLHKDFLGSFEDKASRDITKKVFEWLKSNEAEDSLDQITQLSFMERCQALYKKERELYDECCAVYCGEYSDLHKEVLNNFVELLNGFLRLTNASIDQKWARTNLKSYLDASHDKIQSIKEHKDLLTTLEDKASTNIVKKIFWWLKDETMEDGLYQIIQDLFTGNCQMFYEQEEDLYD